MKSNPQTALSRLYLWALAAGIFFGAPCESVSRAEDNSESVSDLKVIVEQLQRQNAEFQSEMRELRQEVSDLKKEKSGHASKVAKADDPVAPDNNKSAIPRSDRAAPPMTEERMYRFELSGFIQPQFEAGDVSAYDGRLPGPLTPKTNDRFRVRRARIAADGDFLHEFQVHMEGDFSFNDLGLNVRDAQGRTLASSTNRVGFHATDVFVNWHESSEANIKIGQFKAPFGYEQLLVPDTKLGTIERSQVSEALTPERQIGVEAWGYPLARLWPEEKDLLNYAAGVFNGTGRNITTNDNNKYMYVARLESQFFAGKLGNVDASARVGANYLTSEDAKGTLVTPAGNVLVGMDGSLSSFTLPSNGRREAWGIDGSLHVGPFDLTAEYIDEEFRPETNGNVAPAFQAFDAHGYYVVGSYYLLPKKLQLVAKWEDFDPGQLDDDGLRSITGGVNYYIHKSDVKLMANYLHTWSDFRGAHPGFGKDQFDEVFLRLQVVFF